MKEWIKANKKLILISISIIILSLFLSLRQEQPVINDGKIKRDTLDGSVTLDIDLDGKIINGMELRVLDKEDSEEETKILFEDAKLEIIKKILHENGSIERVTEDLNFFDSMNSFPFSFSFYVTPDGKIDENGHILSPDPFEAVIEVTGERNGFKDSFEVPVSVFPSDRVKERLLRESVENGLKDLEEKTRNEEFFTLPSEMLGKKVTFREVKRNADLKYLFAGVLTVIALFAAGHEDKKKEEKKRKDLILNEYPVIIHNMSMYISAGMSIRNTWKKIVEDSKESGRRNPIYEEMETAVNEMESGIAETVAYERFAMRIGIPEINRFMALLNQNIKRGSTRLPDLLAGESNKAYENMKYSMKKKGEEASTRLLMPMMLLMIMVMAIIMVPAFFSI